MSLINCPECNKEISDKAKVCVHCGSPLTLTIIGTPVKIKNLLICQNDFTDMMSFNDAKLACYELGDGYRLPTKEELSIMYKFKGIIGGFKLGYYWSSKEDYTKYGNKGAWYQSFTSLTEIDISVHQCYVRAVKSL
jgi:hypothetical protein